MDTAQQERLTTDPTPSESTISIQPAGDQVPFETSAPIAAIGGKPIDTNPPVPANSGMTLVKAAVPITIVIPRQPGHVPEGKTVTRQEELKMVKVPLVGASDHMWNLVAEEKIRRQKEILAKLRR